MTLTPKEDGSFVANGSKYYIGNGNEAAIVSVFGKMAGSNDYVFFAADPKRPGYRLVKNVVASQSYVAEFELADYPVAAGEVLIRGREAWDAALNTVNVGKYNLGWASIGICTHAFHEALNHAAARRLYGMAVTDFPHVARMFVDAWARLVAMKVFAFRASDYLRAASLEDRRYLLYNPLVKMKVTTEGEKVVDLLWDVIAAKGFEKDMVFEMAARDIRALPKLEGTVHVNIALIVKFLANWLFRPASCPEVGRRTEPAHDAFLFAQGPASGLGKIRFHDWAPAFEKYARIPNVALFREQLGAFRELVAAAAPTEEPGEGRRPPPRRGRPLRPRRLRPPRPRGGGAPRPLGRRPRPALRRLRPRLLGLRPEAPREVGRDGEAGGDGAAPREAARLRRGTLRADLEGRGLRAARHLPDERVGPGAPGSGLRSTLCGPAECRA